MSETDGQVEQALLAAMLHDFEQLQVHNAFGVLHADDFQFPGHGFFYDAFKGLVQSGHRVTPINLIEQLRRAGKLGDYLDADYIQRLAEKDEPPSMIEDYALLVRDAATRRQIKEAGIAIQQSITQCETPEEALIFSQSQLIKIAERGSSKRPFLTASESLVSAMEVLQERIENPSDIIGMSSGFRKFDLLTMGLRPADLWYIGARPSMGKTSFLLNVIEHVALKLRIPVAFFSAEMPQSDIMLKLLASVSEIDHNDLQQGKLTMDQRAKLARAQREIDNAPLYINDESSITPGRIKLVCQQIMMQHQCQLGFIGIDYLQLLHPDRQIGKGDNANLNVAEVSRKLKQLAKDLKLPVACLSQLSRGLESRQDKRPMLSDLRDSGSIEADADIVTFIYRDEYYNQESKKPGVAEILLAKQRNGQTGMFELGWDYKRTKFRNPHGPSVSETSYQMELPPI